MKFWCFSKNVFERNWKKNNKNVDGFSVVILWICRKTAVRPVLQTDEKSDKRAVWNLRMVTWRCELKHVIIKRLETIKLACKREAAHTVTTMLCNEGTLFKYWRAAANPNSVNVHVGLKSFAATKYCCTLSDRSQDKHGDGGATHVDLSVWNEHTRETFICYHAFGSDEKNIRIVFKRN